MQLVIPLLIALRVAAAQPEPKTTALAVVEMAVKAHGGVDAINKLRVAQVRYTVRGSFPGLPVAGEVDIQVDETYQMPQRIKKVIKGKAAGMDVSLIWAVNGDKWWYTDKDGKPVVSEQKIDVEHQYRPLLPVEDLARYKAAEWSLVAGADANERVVRAKSEKAKVNAVFHFDKNTGLLRTITTKRILPKTTKEIEVEARFGDYKDVDGVKLPMKQTIYHDGKKVCEIQVDRVRFFKQLDNRIFAAP